MANQLLAQHGPVKLWLQRGLGLRQHTVTLDDDGNDRFIAGVTQEEDARRLANIAHKAMKRATTDPVATGAAAILAHQATDLATQMAREYGRAFDVWLPEATNIVTNTLLGLCPDGCCGGPECMEDADEIAAWKTWRTRLHEAQRLLGPA